MPLSERSLFFPILEIRQFLKFKEIKRDKNKNKKYTNALVAVVVAPRWHHRIPQDGPTIFLGPYLPRLALSLSLLYFSLKRKGARDKRDLSEWAREKEREMRVSRESSQAAAALRRCALRKQQTLRTIQLGKISQTGSHSSLSPQAPRARVIV